MINYVETVNFNPLFWVEKGVEVYWKMAITLNLALCIEAFDL